MSVHSRGLAVPALTALGPMGCRKEEEIYTGVDIRKMLVDVSISCCVSLTKQIMTIISQNVVCIPFMYLNMESPGLN